MNDDGLLDTLLTRLKTLRHDVAADGQDIFSAWQPHIQRRAAVLGALNLAQYLALRRRDLRDLQPELSRLGLSSLGRSEGRVLANIDAVIATLERLVPVLSDAAQPATYSTHPSARAFTRGKRILERNTRELFGNLDSLRRTRIMVTMPSEAADNQDLLRDLLERGMDCIRINCAHDTPDDWAAMIKNLRRAEREVGRSCKVLMDLGGPKPRTMGVTIPKGTRLKIGDRLRLTRKLPKATKEFPYQAACSLPEIFDQVQVNDSVWIDDGKIGLIVEARDDDGLTLIVTHARAKGERLRDDKGLNFPDTHLKLSALTDKDLQDLDFVAANADIIGYSFVQEAEDVERLQLEIGRRVEHPEKIGLILKIETNLAVRNLPDLIARAAGKQPTGVMIARGDLAVQLGYERMAEIQEELLWMCEAAYVPIVWATQVLDKLVSSGTPSRSEMTDAAMAGRAECVMLNKGDYVGDAVSILNSLLTRMRAHQSKKTPRLRALQSWANFISAGE